MILVLNETKEFCKINLYAIIVTTVYVLLEKQRKFIQKHACVVRGTLCTILHPSTGITDNNDRQKYLDLAEECGLDLAQITKRVVENIRNRSDLNITSLKESQIESANTNISEVSLHMHRSN